MCLVQFYPMYIMYMLSGEILSRVSREGKGKAMMNWNDERSIVPLDANPTPFVYALQCFLYAQK